jgi:hypothetical protein
MITSGSWRNRRSALAKVSRSAADLDLVDAGHLVLDRILDREDLDVGLVQPVERRVERRRLAAAGGAGNQQDAVRLEQDVEEFLERVLFEAQPLEVERHASLVENTHHDRLAVHGRYGRDAQIDFLALHPQPDAPVLREPALGDIEVGHDLHARDHGRRKSPRWRLDLVQDPVDAVAHNQTVLERLDVDVRCSGFERVGDDERDEPDHRPSEARSFNCCVGVEGEVVSSTSPDLPSADLPTPYRRSSAASSSVGIATSGLTLRPVTISKALMV